MHPIHRGLLLAALALPLAQPGHAEARGGGRSDPGERITLSAPGPKQILAEAQAALQAGDLARTTSGVERAQDRLLRDSLASNLPAEMDRGAMRDAIPVLDRARQALARGDAAAAGTAIAQAQRML